MASSVFSGARAIFSIDQKSVGFAAGVSGSESIDYEPVDVLDNLEVAEFVPVAYRVTLSAQIFRIIGSSLKQRGIFPINSEDTSIIQAGELTCTVNDRITGNTIASFQRCKCSEHSFDITARGITSENVNFVAIRLKDEANQSVTGA